MRTEALICLSCSVLNTSIVFKAKQNQMRMSQGIIIIIIFFMCLCHMDERNAYYLQRA